MTLFVLFWIGLIVLLLCVGLAVKAFGTVVVGGIAASRILGFAGAAAVFGLVGALIYVLIRLSFFVTPVTIAENKIDLIRAWTLTRGNFWRILWVETAVFVPLLALSWALQWALLGVHALPANLLVPHNAGNLTHILGTEMQELHNRLPYTLAISFFLTPLQLGLTLGAAAAAYRALVPLSGPGLPAADVPEGDMRGTGLAPETAAS
jgi:hypothetical protein